MPTFPPIRFDWPREFPEAFLVRVKHPLEKSFILGRDLMDLLRRKPFDATRVPATCTLYHHSWSVGLKDLPAADYGYVSWNLPEPAKSIYVQWAMETQAPKVHCHMRLYKGTIGAPGENCVAVKLYPFAAAADHVIYKLINDVETVLATEAVDLWEGTANEFAFYADFYGSRYAGDAGYYHAYRARMRYDTALTVDELEYRERTFGDLNLPNTFTYVDKVVFLSVNDDVVARTPGPVQVHPSTRNPLAIFYTPL